MNYWFEILKARALHGLENYDEALALFEAVFEQHPGSWRTVTGLKHSRPRRTASDAQHQLEVLHGCP